MLVLAASAILLLAQAAPAAEAKPEPAKAEKPAKPKLVCRNETPMGSVIPKRVCRTPEQMAAELEEAQRLRADRDANCRGPNC